MNPSQLIATGHIPVFWKSWAKLQWAMCYLTVKLRDADSLSVLSVCCFLNVIPAACQRRDNLFASNGSLSIPQWVQDANSLESYILFEPKVLMIATGFLLHMLLIMKKIVCWDFSWSSIVLMNSGRPKGADLARRRVQPWAVLVAALTISPFL